MRTFWRRTAFVANVVLVLCLSLFLLPRISFSNPGDQILFLLFYVAPVLSLLALWDGPDKEERRLRRLLSKAELRKRIKDLGEDPEI